MRDFIYQIEMLPSFRKSLKDPLLFWTKSEGRRAFNVQDFLTCASVISQCNSVSGEAVLPAFALCHCTNQTWSREWSSQQVTVTWPVPVRLNLGGFLLWKTALVLWIQSVSERCCPPAVGGASRAEQSALKGPTSSPALLPELLAPLRGHCHSHRQPLWLCPSRVQRVLCAFVAFRTLTRGKDCEYAFLKRPKNSSYASSGLPGWRTLSQFIAALLERKASKLLLFISWIFTFRLDSRFLWCVGFFENIKMVTRWSLMLDSSTPVIISSEVKTSSDVCVFVVIHIAILSCWPKSFDNNGVSNSCCEDDGCSTFMLTSSPKLDDFYLRSLRHFQGH